MIIDEVGAAAADDDVRSAAAVKGLGARAGRDRVGRRRADHTEGAADPGGRDISEVLQDRRAGSVLIGGIGQIEAHAGGENQRVVRA